jgi:two-component system, NtrC family, response regulator AtoC
VADCEILIVDDDKSMTHLTSMLLQKAGFHTTICHSIAEASPLLESRYFPIVVTDLILGDGDGFLLMPYLKKHRRESLIIFMTGYGSIDTTVKAFHEGAFEYISKPFDLPVFEEELLSAVNRAVSQLELTTKPDESLLPLPNSARPLIGKSPQMVHIYRSVAKASLSRGNVVILGESGTGKELIARAIHDNSPWKSAPFVTVNCGALTETLLESELFGYVKGAFTGATMNKKGLLEEADGGTLFLDEIGDISLASQVKLLRAIQEGEIRPVGSVEIRKIDIRVIAATHRNLKQMVAEERFREDLFYRLKVFLISVPPLRERIQDLPDIANYVLSQVNRKNGGRKVTFSRDAMELLKDYPWPGNIRELQNAIERAVAMSHKNILFPEDLPEEIRSYFETFDVNAPTTQRETHTSAHPSAAATSLEDLEKEHILKTLESVNYNKSKTAEILGIDRGTLYRKAVRYSIPLQPSEKGHSDLN